MRRHLITLLLFTSSLATLSCVTNTASPRPPRAASTGKPARPLAKEGQKVVTPPAAAPTEQVNALEPTFKRLSDISVQLRDEDVRTASGLYPAAANSLEEATLVVAQLRLLRLQIEQKSGFEARDLYDKAGGENAEKPRTATTVSMEKPFDDLQLDVLTILQNNSHLQTRDAMFLVKDVFERSSSRPEFAEKVTALLESASQRWADLKPRPAPTEAPPPPVDTIPPAAETTSGAVTTGEASPLDQVQAGDVKIAATDLKRSDMILMQAQKLADKGEFKQAIEQAGRIENQDPFFEQAREKIKVYSNRAVQDLRQQAAQAFQNAMPMSDPKAREAYLVQARQLLEKAIQEYPSADQLDRVRENLTVITQNLESLAKDSTPNGVTPKQ
jgi:hypothetical protein